MNSAEAARYVANEEEVSNFMEFLPLGTIAELNFLVRSDNSDGEVSMFIYSALAIKAIRCQDYFSLNGTRFYTTSEVRMPIILHYTDMPESDTTRVKMYKPPKIAAFLNLIMGGRVRIDQDELRQSMALLRTTPRNDEELQRGEMQNRLTREDVRNMRAAAATGDVTDHRYLAIKERLKDIGQMLVKEPILIATITEAPEFNIGIPNGLMFLDAFAIQIDGLVFFPCCLKVYVDQSVPISKAHFKSVECQYGKRYKESSMRMYEKIALSTMPTIPDLTPQVSSEILSLETSRIIIRDFTIEELLGIEKHLDMLATFSTFEERLKRKASKTFAKMILERCMQQKLTDCTDMIMYKHLNQYYQRYYLREGNHSQICKLYHQVEDHLNGWAQGRSENTSPNSGRWHTCDAINIIGLFKEKYRRDRNVDFMNEGNLEFAELFPANQLGYLEYRS